MDQGINLLLLPILLVFVAYRHSLSLDFGPPPSTVDEVAESMLILMPDLVELSMVLPLASLSIPTPTGL